MESLVKHPLEPVFDNDSKVLILGTMPSPKSRENGFYYAHPQNRFWKILSEIFSEPFPVSNEQKKALVFRHHIALWDVLQSCSIDGAEDSTIRNPVPNDIKSLLDKTNIQNIFTTGRKAFQLYQKFCLSTTGIQAVALPSTSPANQRYYTYEDILREYRVLLAYTE